MKTLGLIGGMSWESSLEYYRLINIGVNRRLGKNHSARCILYSLDFQPIEDLQYRGDWESLEQEIIGAGINLKAAGAQVIGLCTNTMHKVTDHFEKETGVRLIHIADAVGERIASAGLKKVGLLGTVFTMEQDFYRQRIESGFGVEVIIPDQEDRKEVNRIIYEELVKGIIREESRQAYTGVMHKLQARGAEGIILGCTEIGLLVKEFSCDLFDSTPIHAEKLVEAMLE